MEDLTVSEDNDHLGTSVRDGQEPSQSLIQHIKGTLQQGDGQIPDKG